MRVCDVHVEVFAWNAIDLNNYKIYIKTDELLVSSVAGGLAVEETNTIIIEIRMFSNLKSYSSVLQWIKLLVMSLKGLNDKTNWLVVDRQS
jgi:hypothetical protein